VDPTLGKAESRRQGEQADQQGHDDGLQDDGTQGGSVIPESHGRILDRVSDRVRDPVTGQCGHESRSEERQTAASLHRPKSSAPLRAGTEVDLCRSDAAWHRDDGP
jgi:hypothetical protein